MDDDEMSIIYFKKNTRYTVQARSFAFFIIFAAVSIFLNQALPAFATLSCSVTTAAACVSPGVVVLRMSSSTNAHAELPSQSNAGYDTNAICCTGVTGLSNSCSNTSVAVVAHLASTTNAHVEEATFANFSNNACLSVSTGSVTVGYTSTNCSAYDTTLASLPATTNSHIGSSTAYAANKICVKYVNVQSLSFSISTSTIGFGNLSASNARYATGDLLGSSTAVVAHTITVSTNASSGYSVLLSGATLTSGANTITAIGGSNTASVAGTKQFGLNLTASGGTGVVSSPYSGAGFAYAGTATTTSLVASEPAGDSTNTVYSATYIANISASTPAASYSTALTYLVTANF